MSAMWWQRAERGAAPGPRRDLAGTGRAAFCAAAWVLLPNAASACPVCFAAGGGRLLQTYYLTAALLTLMPLVIVGLFAGWLRRRFKDEPE
jgi:hypothetical protein